MSVNTIMNGVKIVCEQEAYALLGYFFGHFQSRAICMVKIG